MPRPRFACRPEVPRASFVIPCLDFSTLDRCLWAIASPILFKAVTGTATILVAPGKKVDHLGIKAELIGQIGEWNLAKEIQRRREMRHGWDRLASHRYRSACRCFFCHASLGDSSWRHAQSLGRPFTSVLRAGLRTAEIYSMKWSRLVGDNNILPAMQPTPEAWLSLSCDSPELTRLVFACCSLL